MATIIGIILTFGIIILQILLCLGFPLGEYAMGGKYKIFPPKMRIANVFSILILIFFSIVLLQLGNVASIQLLEPQTCKTIGYYIGGYLLVNTIMNLCSRSKKERIVMTPISLSTAICFLYNAYIYC